MPAFLNQQKDSALAKRVRGSTLNGKQQLEIRSCDGITPSAVCSYGVGKG